MITIITIIVLLIAIIALCSWAANIKQKKSVKIQSNQALERWRVKHEERRKLDLEYRINSDKERQRIHSKVNELKEKNSNK